MLKALSNSPDQKFLYVMQKSLVRFSRARVLGFTGISLQSKSFQIFIFQLMLNQGPWYRLTYWRCCDVGQGSYL